MTPAMVKGVTMTMAKAQTQPQPQAQMLSMVRQTTVCTWSLDGVGH
jgi:hypothetical protein